MPTLEEVHVLITQLSREQRGVLADWIRHFTGAAHVVAEPAATYGLKTQSSSMSVEEYLQLDASSPIKHEYVGGAVFAMSGERVPHGIIASNLVAELNSHLRSGPCRAFGSGVKLYLRANEDDIFYYPDVTVVCGPQDLDADRITGPKLVIEVLSPSTERTDRKEKAVNYRSIATLDEYVMVAQRTAEVTFQRRGDRWRPTVLDSLEASAEFRSIGLSLPLKRIYEGVL